MFDEIGNMVFLVGLTLNKRICAAIGFAALFITEIIIGAFCGGFIRAYVGDVLVIPLIYCLVRIFYTRDNKLLPIAVGSLGILAEIAQYFDLCGILGIDKQSAMGIMIGSHADIGDIFCYIAGVILIYVFEYIYSRIACRDKRAMGEG